jgi:hypothetical protein
MTSRLKIFSSATPNTGIQKELHAADSTGNSLRLRLSQSKIPNLKFQPLLLCQNPIHPAFLINTYGMKGRKGLSQTPESLIAPSLLQPEIVSAPRLAPRQKGSRI